MWFIYTHTHTYTHRWIFQILRLVQDIEYSSLCYKVNNFFYTQYCAYFNPQLLVYPSPFFPGGSDGKESTCSVQDPGSIPGLGRSLGEGNGNPLQNSCLQNPMGRGAWWAVYSPWGRRESDTTEPLTVSSGNYKFVFYICDSIHILSISSFVLFFLVHI